MKTRFWLSSLSTARHFHGRPRGQVRLLAPRWRILTGDSTHGKQRRTNFRYGASRVNIQRGPDSQNLDAILSKSFRLGKESRWRQFRFEGFNVLNHANFGQPNGNINQPTQVGRIFRAGAPRILQLALKLNF